MDESELTIQDPLEVGKYSKWVVVYILLILTVSVLWDEGFSFFSFLVPLSNLWIPPVWK